MKKFITAALIAFISLTGFAQERHEMHDKEGMHDKDGMRKEHQMEKLSPEQHNELMLKKMTLDLDLNTSQQKEIGKIIADQSAKRKDHMKKMKEKMDKKEEPSSDEIFEMKSKMLDDKIAMKEKMKKILTPEQYKKWEKSEKDHHKGMNKKMMHKGCEMNSHKGCEKDSHKECKMKK